MGSKDKPPKWIKALLEEQTNSLKSIINDALTVNNSTDQPSKRLKSNPTPKQKVLKQRKPAHESDDDFDTRFGHLIGLNVNHDNEDDDDEDNDNDDNDNDDDHYDEEEDDDEAATAAADTDHDDLNESIDEDLVEILDKTPNWEPNTSLKKVHNKNL